MSDTVVREIPKGLVHLTAGDMPAHALVVDKSRQSITLYRFDGQYHRMWEGRCATGREQGDKRVAGDGRTPEGVFLFTEAFEDRYLAPLYGTRAFVTDYPNLLDQLAGRNGSAIWLHGTNKPLKARSSNGCVALENTDIDRLAKAIDLNRTPILIGKQIDFAPVYVQQRQANKIIDFLDRWRDTLVTGTYHQYLSFYHSQYLPPLNWWADWAAIRNAAKEADRPIQLARGRTEVFAHNDTFVAVMDLHVSDGKKTAAAGRRKLFLTPYRRSFRIVGDAIQGMENGNAAVGDAPLVAGARSLGQLRDAPGEVTALVERWRTAWVEKDHPTYGDCYATGFWSDNMNRDAWLSKKRGLGQRYRFIQVRLSNVRIFVDGTTATASFRQEYRSDAFRVVGIKSLRFIMEDGKWKILRETFQPL